MRFAVASATVSDMSRTSEEPYIAIIGGANFDIHGRSTNALKSRDSNPGTVHTSAGGVARNIAESLARLGTDTRLISAIGDDEHGNLLTQLCRDAGIDMRYVQRIASAQTSTYLSVLDDAGDMQVAVADMAITDELTAERLQAQQAMLERASLIVLDTNLPDDTLAWITDTLADHRIFVDTVSTAKAPRIKPYLGCIHTLKAGTIEAEALTGLEAQTESQLRELAEWVHAQGVQRLFVTRGDQGVFYSTAEAQGCCQLSTRKHIIENAGGAGDAFVAGLAYACIKEWPLDRSVRFALAAANITLSDNATSSPGLSLAAIESILENERAS